MVLDASLLNTQHYKVRIKGKVEQSREGVAPSPTHWCSSYRKESLRVTLDYGRQLYFYLYKPLNFLNELMYIGSNISSSESDVNSRIGKEFSAIDRLSLVWKSDLSGQIKREFANAVGVSVLLHGCFTRILTKPLEKKLNENLTGILHAFWKQHPTKLQLLYGHFPPISQTTKIRLTRHAGHYWWSKEEIISDVLLQMDAPVLAHQNKLTFTSSVRTVGAVLVTYQVPMVNSTCLHLCFLFFFYLYFMQLEYCGNSTPLANQGFRESSVLRERTKIITFSQVGCLFYQMLTAVHFWRQRQRLNNIRSVKSITQL